MVPFDGIRRVLFGHFTMPDDGDPRAGEKVVVCGYLIDHPGGLILLDTGIAEGHEEVEELYHPVAASPGRGARHGRRDHRRHPGSS
jgi:hypothetical protein